MRSLRSLLAAAALLMAAYSIAASPNMMSADGAGVHLPSLGSVLSGVPQSMGFSSQRLQALDVAERDSETFVFASGTFWVFILAALGVAGAMLDRRFGSR